MEFGVTETKPSTFRESRSCCGWYFKAVGGRDIFVVTRVPAVIIMAKILMIMMARINAIKEVVMMRTTIIKIDIISLLAL